MLGPALWTAWGIPGGCVEVEKRLCTLCTLSPSDSAVPVPDRAVLGVFSEVPYVSAGWNTVRVPPRARFPTSGALFWASDCGDEWYFSASPQGAFYLTSAPSLVCWGSGCVGSWSLMAADGPGEMTGEQRASEFVSAGLILRIAASFPCVLAVVLRPYFFMGISTPGDMT